LSGFALGLGVLCEFDARDAVGLERVVCDAPVAGTVEYQPCADVGVGVGGERNELGKCCGREEVSSNEQKIGYFLSSEP
jgi:hypothetical protein